MENWSVIIIQGPTVILMWHTWFSTGQKSLKSQIYWWAGIVLWRLSYWSKGRPRIPELDVEVRADCSRMKTAKKSWLTVSLKCKKIISDTCLKYCKPRWDPALPQMVASKSNVHSCFDSWPESSLKTVWQPVKVARYTYPALIEPIPMSHWSSAEGWEKYIQGIGRN